MEYSGNSYEEIFFIKSLNSKGCPESVKLYQEIYGRVEKTNQQLFYYLTKSRSVHKQNHLLFSIIKMYTLCNMHTIWCNIEPLSFQKRKMSNTYFRSLTSGSTMQTSKCTSLQFLLKLNGTGCPYVTKDRAA